MSKLNCFVLTVIISFFSLFLFKTESATSFKRLVHTHDIKIDNAFNTCAISTNNSFEHLVNFEKEKEQPSVSCFYTTASSLNKRYLNTNLQYLKICGFFDLNLTTRTIIYPFHSFL